MYSVSVTFKNAMKAGVKEVDSYIKLADNTTITAAGDLVSTKVDVENHLGQVAMRLITLELMGNHADLKGQEVKLYVGVKSSIGWQYIDYGTFLIREATQNKAAETTEAKGYDKMVYFNQTYDPEQFTFPATLYELAATACNKAGVTLGSESWPNSTLVINHDRYEGIAEAQYRDLIEDIAASSGTIAMMSGDSLYFKAPSSATETLSEANLMSYDEGDKYGPINAVVLARSPQEDNVALQNSASIETYGLTEWRADNVQLIDDQRENAIQGIYNNIQGLTYYPFEAKTEGHAWHEIGDVINTSVGGETKKHFITYISLLIDGSIIEILKGVKQESSGTDYTRAGSISQRIARAEILVNKQNATIQSIVEKVDGYDEKISEITQTAENISLSVSAIGESLEKQQTTFSVEADGAYIKQGREGYYSKFTDAGMEITSAGEVIAKATSETFKAPSFTTTNWTMREEENGKVFNIFRGDL